MRSPNKTEYTVLPNFGKGVPLDCEGKNLTMTLRNPGKLVFGNNKEESKTSCGSANSSCGCSVDVLATRLIKISNYLKRIQHAEVQQNNVPYDEKFTDLFKEFSQIMTTGLVKPSQLTRLAKLYGPNIVTGKQIGRAHV